MRLRMTKNVKGFEYILFIEIEMNQKKNYIYPFGEETKKVPFTYRDGYFHLQAPIILGTAEQHKTFYEIKCPKEIRGQIEEYNIETPMRRSRWKKN